MDGDSAPTLKSATKQNIMFEFEGTKYTLEQIQGAATKRGVSVEDYISEFKITRTQTSPPDYFETNEQTGKLEPTLAFMGLTEEDALPLLEEAYPNLKGQLAETGLFWVDKISFPNNAKGHRQTADFDNNEVQAPDALVKLKDILSSMEAKEDELISRQNTMPASSSKRIKTSPEVTEGVEKLKDKMESAPDSDNVLTYEVNAIKERFGVETSVTNPRGMTEEAVKLMPYLEEAGLAEGNEAFNIAHDLVMGNSSTEELKKYWGLTQEDAKEAKLLAVKEEISKMVGEEDSMPWQSEMLAAVLDEALETDAYSKRHARMLQDEKDYKELSGKELLTTVTLGERTYIPRISHKSGRWTSNGFVTPYDDVNPSISHPVLEDQYIELEAEGTRLGKALAVAQGYSKKIKAMNVTSDSSAEERAEYNNLINKYNKEIERLETSGTNSDINKFQKELLIHQGNVDKYTEQQSALEGYAPILEVLHKNYNWGTLAVSSLETGLIAPITQFAGGFLSAGRLERLEERQAHAAKYQPMHINAEFSLAWAGQTLAEAIPTLAPLALHAAAMATPLGKTLSPTMRMVPIMGTFFSMASGGDLIAQQLRRKQAKESLPLLQTQLLDATDPDKKRLLISQIADAKRIAGLSDWQIGGSAVAKGASEIIGEGFGTMRVLRGGRLLSQHIGARSFKGLVAGSLKVGKGLGIELAEEALVQMSNSIVDYVVLGEDTHIFDGIDKDFIASTAFTSLLIQGPSIGRGIISVAASEMTSYKTHQANLAAYSEIEKLEKRLIEADSKGKAQIEEEIAGKIRDMQIMADADIANFRAASPLTRRKWLDNRKKAQRIATRAEKLGRDYEAAVMDADPKLAEQIANERRDLESALTKALEDGDRIIMSNYTDGDSVGGRATETVEMNFQIGKKRHNSYVGSLIAERNGGALVEVTENMVFTNVKGEQQLTAEAFGSIAQKHGKSIADKVAEDVKAGDVTATWVDESKTAISYSGYTERKIQELVLRIAKAKREGRGQQVIEDLQLQLERSSGGGLHEIFHGYHTGRILEAGGGLTKAAQQAIAEMEQNLQGHLEQNPNNKAAQRLLEKVRAAYSKKQKEPMVLEEILGALGEMKLRGLISFQTTNENNYHTNNFIKSLANDVVNGLNKIPGINLNTIHIAHLETAGDIGNYIEGFRRSVVSGATSLQDPGDEEEAVSRDQLGLSDKIQDIYEKHGVDGKWDIASTYRGMATIKVSKYRDTPDYETVKDLMVDEVLTGKRGVIDMVQDYNPDLGVPLSAYINKYLEVRTIEVAKRLLGDSFKEDITERKDIVAQPASQSTDAQKEEAAPSVATFIRKKLRLDEKQMNVVRRAAVRALVTAPGVGKTTSGKPRAFYDHLLKTYNTLLFKMVKNHMGTGADYRMWVKQNFEILDKHISITSLLNGKMSLFYKPVLGANGKQSRMSVIEANNAGIPLDKAGAGPLKWQRTSPTLDEFYDWAMGKGMAANTKPARKTTMARLIARELGLDATMETLNNAAHPKFNEEGNAEDGSIDVLAHVMNATGGDLAEAAVIGQISVAVDRSQDQRFQMIIGEELTIKQIEELRKGQNFINVNTGSPALNLDIRNIITLLEYWGNYGEFTAENHAYAMENSEAYKALFNKMLKRYNDKRVKTIAKKLKDTEAITDYIIKSVNAGTEFRGRARVIGKRKNYEKSKHLELAKTLFKSLVDQKDMTEIEAIKLFVSILQPSMSQRGEASDFRTNKVFFDEIITPVIKGTSLEKLVEFNRISLKGKRVRDKDSKEKGDFYSVITLKEKVGSAVIKITPEGTMTQDDPFFAALIKGEASLDQIKQWDDRAVAIQTDIIKVIDILNNNEQTEVIDWFLPMLGDMTRSYGRWGFRLGGIYTDPNDINGKKTIEHQVPFDEIGAAYGLYAKNAIKKPALLDQLALAEIYIHPQSAAKKLNKDEKSTDLRKGGKNKAGQPYRLAAYNEGNDFRSFIEVKEDIDAKKKQSLNLEMNQLLEDSTGTPAGKVISPTEAIKRGKKASRYLKNQGIMVSSAEDFVGLMYKMLAQGKTGEAQLEWLLDKLVIPYDVAVDNVSIARLLKSEQLRKISKSAKLKGMLKAEAFEGMTGEDAVRLYIWNLRGVAKGKFVKEAYVDMAVDYMSKNPELKAYADAVHAIAGAVAYAAPNARWAHGSIEMDLVGGINGELRALELERSGWSLNVKEIFSEDNLNKLEALYGVNYVTALNNILQRMKSGRNRIDQETDKTSKKAQGWISNQVGAIMFLNMRSALLQGLSALNYINTTDHNPLQAIRRMLNVPQYAKDTKFLLGSAFMKDRRMGMRIDVNEEDVARASRDTGNVISRALKIALNKGFIPTRLMDTAAIVIGGAGFYRSRINTYVDSGMSIASAEKMAFADFRKATINSQQSSDPRMVSQQQASTMGRFVLQFGNTPGQYTRIQIKAVKDIINGRGDMKAHIGKILYYGMIQQALFTFAQQALWVALLDDDDEWITSEEGRGLVDGMLSSTLRGLGLYGAIIDTAMRTAKVWEKETSKGYMGSNEKVVIEALGISPSVKSIAKKTTNAMNISKYRGDDFGIDPYSLHSPEVEQAAWLLEGTVNIPSKRILDKMHHIESIMSGQNEAWQNVALFFGFQEWQVGAGEGGKKAKQRKLEKKGLDKKEKSIFDMTDAEFEVWLTENP